MPNFDLGILKRNPSPNSNDFLADLFREFKVNVNLPLKDLFKNASQKCNVLYDVNAEFDFTAGSLHPERLKEYGTNEYALNLVEKEFQLICLILCFLGTLNLEEIQRTVKITLTSLKI